MTAEAAKTIDFYFDFISHNAYLAWHALPGLAQEHGYGVEPVPVLFAGFLKGYGQLGPAEIAPKLKWMNRNNLRKALLLGIPLNAPIRHPFNPLFLLRLAAQDMAGDERSRITATLMRGVWVDGLDPNDADGVRAYLDAAGLAAERLVDGASSDAAKAKLKANTDACIARGGFGVPTMIIGDEVFWGYDDLPFLERFVAGEDPLTGADMDAHMAAWERSRAAGRHRERS